MTDDTDTPDDACPLADDDLDPIRGFHDAISFCPFCGGDARPERRAGIGKARCESCNVAFWVEL